MSEFGDNFTTITDEDGVTYELEILATVEYNDSLYYALVPADDDDEKLEQEVSILKLVKENGEEMLDAIRDEEELESVYEKLLDQLYEEEQDEDED